MLPQVRVVPVLVLLCAQLLSLLQGCVLLLNGWTPVSVRDRAQLAEVVITGSVLRTFKDQRTSSKTYSAEVEILQVYKGVALLEQVSSEKVYNISNFGDKPACYADVHQGEQYIFFLTLFEKRLSAKYDDIFGATADFSLENEDEVLAAQGWDSWSPWSTCSRTCRHGQRTRHRACQRENKECEGKDSEEQACNMFPCHSVVNLLEQFGAEKLPSGVRKSSDRPGAYQIASTAQLNAPTNSIFQGKFPVNFSILLGLNLSPDFSGYVFTVSDSMKKQRIGIHYAAGEWRFEYADQDGLPGVASPVFEADLADGSWHLVSFEVKGQEITMFYDCIYNLTRSLLRTRWPIITVNSVMSIGPFFAQNGSPFEGEIEQLVISKDYRMAARHCRKGGLINGMENEQKDGDSREMTTPHTATTTTTHPDSAGQMFQWSEWSPCSVSCGRGMQTRTLYCRNNVVEPSACIPRHIPRHQARRCSAEQCPGKCRLSCLNGGRCDGNGRCVCGLGYAGQQCETALCYPDCRNGGRCVEPYVCQCPHGYTGTHCQAALCDPPCRNGGYCISPGQCSCPYGYLAPDCAPYCQSPCLNGGSCVGPNLCLCPAGFAGARCERAVCDGGCLNGGQCVGPNRCQCQYGYSGPKCQHATCNPPCENGGACLKPYQCTCKPGTIGWYCEHFTCSKPCKNGGVCSGPNKCTCPDGFRGSRCQKRACGGGCLNGGRCVKKRKCRCLPGYKGKRCQKKKCQVEGSLEPYVKSYLRSVREHFESRCGPWHVQPCIRTRLKYIRVSREIFRAVFRCK